MFRYAVLGIIGLAGNAWAQQASPQAEAPAALSSPAALQSSAAISMEEPLPGDHWTYEVRDEIIGTISATRQNIVTDVTPMQVNTRVETVGKPNAGNIVFDRSWNMTVSGPWKFSPNDGSGIQLPLSVGKTWNFQCDEVDAANANIWKRAGKSTIVGRESVTTKAGTFETFKIETSYSTRNVKDPTRKAEVTLQIWYAPAIDHWVKRTFASRVNNLLTTNNTIELVEYGRKQ